MLNTVSAAKTTFLTQDDILNITVDTDSGTKIQIESDRIDLNTSKIDWIIDDKKLLSGENKTIFYSKNKIVGKKVTVNISNSDGIYKSEFNILGNDLILHWEGINSTTPVWWQGKPQVSFGNEVRVWAIADVYDKNGKVVDNRDLNYLWYIDDMYNSKLSGFGKNFANIFIGVNSLNDTKLRVSVRDKSGESVVDQTIYIENQDLSIGVYRQNIKEDNKDNSVGEYVFDFIPVNNFAEIENKNFNLILEPMFFGVNNKSLLSYSWDINGIFDDVSKFVKNITLKDNTSGDLSLTVSVTNSKKFKETQTENLNITIK